MIVNGQAGAGWWVEVEGCAEPIQVRPWLLSAASRPRPLTLAALTQGNSAAQGIVVGLLHRDKGLNHNEYL